MRHTLWNLYLSSPSSTYEHICIFLDNQPRGSNQNMCGRLPWKFALRLEGRLTLPVILELISGLFNRHQLNSLAKLYLQKVMQDQQPL